MPNVVGKRLDVAKSDVKQAGFDDDVKVVGGGRFGVVVDSNWTVCQQDPAGGSKITDAPRLTVGRSCKDGGGHGADSSSASPSETSAPSSPATSASASPTAAANLTIENNRDLAALLEVDDNCDPSVAAFAAKYQGETIEFDGSIVDVQPHEDEQTYFDILVGPGDKGPNTAVGPAFQFEDAHPVDLKFIGAAPSAVSAGQLYRFVAKIGDYNEASCLFHLTPVSLQVRKR